MLATSNLFECTKCGETKNKDLFKKTKQRPNGISSWCKACHSKATTKQVSKDRTKANENHRRWRSKNREIVRENNREYKAKNRQKTSQNFIRHQRMLRHGTTPWSEKDDIKQFYDDCPAGFVVDHIDPLLHPKVCGLHVMSNLQYLPIKHNSIKGNRFDGTPENESWKSYLKHHK